MHIIEFKIASTCSNDYKYAFEHINYNQGLMFYCRLNYYRPEVFLL